MPNHPVRRTLERDVLPYLFSARRLRRQWFFRLHALFGYTTDLVVALTVIGVSTPLLALLSAASGSGKEATQTPHLSATLASVPNWLSIPTAARSEEHTSELQSLR